MIFSSACCTSLSPKPGATLAWTHHLALAAQRLIAEGPVAGFNVTTSASGTDAERDDGTVSSARPRRRRCGSCRRRGRGRRTPRRLRRSVDTLSPPTSSWSVVGHVGHLHAQVGRLLAGRCATCSSGLPMTSVGVDVDRAGDLLQRGDDLLAVFGELVEVGAVDAVLHGRRRHAAELKAATAETSMRRSVGLLGDDLAGAPASMQLGPASPCAPSGSARRT